MTPQELLTSAIVPALTFLNLDSQLARHQLLAIALQESGAELKHRRQVTNSGKEDGPAVSFWMFENGKFGGCAEVLTNPKVEGRMRAACAAHGVAATPSALWEAMETNDVLGAIAARLLLFRLPQPLPKASIDGWNQYVAAWHPGKPHQKTWADNWHTAGRVVRGFV